MYLKILANLIAEKCWGHGLDPGTPPQLTFKGDHLENRDQRSQNTQLIYTKGESTRYQTISKRMCEQRKSKQQRGINILEMALPRIPELQSSLFSHHAGTSRWEDGYVEFSIDCDEKGIGFALMELEFVEKWTLY